jgi:hypothetical protein
MPIVSARRSHRRAAVADRDARAGWTRGTAAYLCATIALLLPLLPAAARADRQVVIPAPPLAPNFSTVTTRAAAAKLVRKHQLVRIHFFPTELGGPKTKANTGYVTPEAAASHALLVEMLAAYVERGRLDHLLIEPEYKGESVVPTRIRVKASHSRGGDSFERVVEVWDCGICPPLDPLPDPDRKRDVTA